MHVSSSQDSVVKVLRVLLPLILTPVDTHPRRDEAIDSFRPYGCVTHIRSIDLSCSKLYTGAMSCQGKLLRSSSGPGTKHLRL